MPPRSGPSITLSGTARARSAMTFRFSRFPKPTRSRLRLNATKESRDFIFCLYINSPYPRNRMIDTTGTKSENNSIAHYCPCASTMTTIEAKQHVATRPSFEHTRSSFKFKPQRLTLKSASIAGRVTSGRVHACRSRWRCTLPHAARCSCKVR